MDNNNAVKKKRGRRKKTLNFEELKNNMFSQVNTRPRICVELMITQEMVEGFSSDQSRLQYNPTVSIVEPLTKDQSLFSSFEAVQKKIVPSDNVVRQVENDAYLKKNDFIESQGKKVVYDNLQELMGRRVIEGTTIKCWHCTLSFTNEPHFLPIRFLHGGKYSKSRFESIGCFCSIPCAMAYGQERHMHRSVNGLHTLHPLCKIKAAPPKESLQEYGGPLTQEEYKTIVRESYRAVKVTRFPEVHIVEQTVIDEPPPMTKSLPKARFLDPQLLKEARKSTRTNKTTLNELLVEEEVIF